MLNFDLKSSKYSSRRNIRTISEWKFLFVLALLQAGVHTLLLSLTNFWQVLDADEAVFGLMGLHILRLKDVSVFYYGQAYMGSLPAFVHAALFAIFGVHLWVLKLSGLIIVSPLAPLAYLTLKNLGTPRKVYLLGSLLLIIPAPAALMSMGRGYAAAMLIVSISFFLLSKCLHEPTDKRATRITQDVQVAVVALGAWINPLTVLITIPCLLTPFFKRLTRWREHLVFRVFIAILVLSPVIYYNIETRAQTMKVVTGFALDLPRGKEDVAEFGLRGVLTRAMQKKLSGYGEGLWKRFVRLWGELLMVNVSHLLPEKSALPGIAIFLVLLVVLGLSAMRLSGGERLRVFLIGGLISLVIVVGFAQQRYVLVAFPVVPIFSTLCLCRRRVIFPTVVLVLLALNFAGALTLRFPGDDFKAVLQFLREKDMRFGYADYYKAYPLTFLSEESVVCSPLGGPNDTDRYPKYSRQVAAAHHVFYLYEADNAPRQLLERYLVEHEISYTVTEISGQKIYYGFSNKILPSDFRSAGISKSKQ